METDLNESLLFHIENNKESQDFFNEHQHHFNKQCKQVLKSLLEGNKITADSAREDFGIRHLARRICSIRESGITVLDNRLPNRCKEYYIQL